MLWDHPHLRGEYKRFDLISLTCSGSPPPTWGIPEPFPGRLLSLRITPTYVGNTESTGRKQQMRKDHPHLRGEYRSKLWTEDQLVGSPPPTWGILARCKRGICLSRITPTYVGNTSVRQDLYQQLQDHPHLRGEYIHGILERTRALGSPPPTWGILQVVDDHSLLARITPTYVGNTQRQP